MPKKGTFFWVLLIFLTGCSFLQGQGSAILIPDIEDQTPTIPTIQLVDGFDFPVGDENGAPWAVTGYKFMDWSTYSNSFHPGEDWNIPGAGNNDFGEPVYSIAHGKVVFSGFNSALGNIIVIEHKLQDGTSRYSQYAHLHERLVRENEAVLRRQQIGTVGRGPHNRFTAHLHFEIRKAAMNPNAWPRTNGVAWDYNKVLEYWVHPSEFIRANRPK